MKSKKKLLLMGVGVMGALAMGVGATSTFAWFTADATVRATTQSPTAQLSVDKDGTVAGIDVQVDFSLVNVAACDLTNDDGDTKFVTQGDLVKDATGGVTAVGEYYLTAVFNNLSDPNIAAMNGKTYKFELTGSGNAKALLDGSGAANSNVANGSSTHLYIYGAVSGTTITLSNKQGVNSLVADYAATPSALSSTNKLFYAIRTNNTTGKEYVTAGETSYKVGGQLINEWAASTNYSTGDKRFYDTAVYNCTSDTTADSKATFSEGDGWSKVCDLHTADKIAVGIGAEVE